MIKRYTRPEMADIWSDLNRYRKWLLVELAACRAMEKIGLVEAGIADRIQTISDKLDPAAIEEIEARTKHDVIAFLTHVEELAGPPARWLHLGMTSSDVLDTATALQTREALDLIIGRAKALEAVLAERSKEHKDTAMVGRTHGIHAEPTTCGLTFALWCVEMHRDIERLSRARESISVGKISGAVGTYANFPPEVESEALASLGLKPETVATQIVQRDRHAEVMAALSITAATIEKIALTVRGWQRTEVAEAREAFTKGQKGSSAMPHKRNPILSENLCGLARVVRSHMISALENIALWHERDISHSSVERVAFPDSTIALHFMLHRAEKLVSGLVIDKEQMEHNLNLTGGLVFSEAVMLSLIKTGLGRQAAYEMVQRCAMAAHDSRGALSFQDALKRDKDVVGRLSMEGIEKLFDLRHHLRHTDAIYDRVFKGENS